MNIFLAVIYIFLLRLIDKTLGTLRALYVNKGRPGIGAVLGFIESAIWVLAISQVIKDLDDPLLIIGYALGFAAGTISGSYIESSIAIGDVVVRIFLQKVSIAWCVTPRKQVKKVLNIVSEISPNAYVTTEATSPTYLTDNKK